MKRLAGLFWILFGLTCSAALVSNQPIPRAVVGGDTYSNVVVESVSAKIITFVHSRGVATLNAQKLTRAERQALGLEAPPPAASTNSAAGSSTLSLRDVTSGSPPAWETVHRTLTAPNGPVGKLRQSRTSMLIAVGFAIMLYLFFCYCLMMICEKAEHPAPALAWIPVLQVGAIYRAANMAPFWFATLMCDIILRLAVAWLIIQGVFKNPPQMLITSALIIIGVMTLIHVVGWVIWCFKICTVREKSPAVGIFVLIPCTQLPALAYLAFSK